MKITIRDYLGQAFKIDKRINSKLEQVSSLRQLATKITSSLSDMPHNPNKNLHSMESIIVKIVDLENEINIDIDSLVDIKRDLVSLIKKINNPEHQLLLELRYLCFKTWDKIASDMEYSTQHIFRIHEKALQDLKYFKSGE